MWTRGSPSIRESSSRPRPRPAGVPDPPNDAHASGPKFQISWDAYFAGGLSQIRPPRPMLTQSCLGSIFPIGRPSVDKTLGQRTPPLPKLVQSTFEEDPPPAFKAATQAKNTAAVTPTKITRDTMSTTSRANRGRKFDLTDKAREFTLAPRALLNTTTSRTKAIVRAAGLEPSALRIPYRTQVETIRGSQSLCRQPAFQFGQPQLQRRNLIFRQ